MRKWRQEIEKTLIREGLAEIAWTTTGKNHQKATACCTRCAPAARVAVVTSLTPSDTHRALKNIRGDVRRQLREKCGTLRSAKATFIVMATLSQCVWHILGG